MLEKNLKKRDDQVVGSGVGEGSALHRVGKWGKTPPELGPVRATVEGTPTEEKQQPKAI